MGIRTRSHNLNSCPHPGQHMWDLRWTQWHWERFLSEYVSFPVSVSFTNAPHSFTSHQRHLLLRTVIIVDPQQHSRFSDCATGSTIRRLNPGRDSTFFSSCNTSRQDLGPTQPPIQCIEFLYRRQSGRVNMLTAYLHMLPRLRINRGIPLLPLYARVDRGIFCVNVVT